MFLTFVNSWDLITTQRINLRMKKENKGFFFGGKKKRVGKGILRDMVYSWISRTLLFFLASCISNFPLYAPRLQQISI